MLPRLRDIPIIVSSAIAGIATYLYATDNLHKQIVEQPSMETLPVLLGLAATALTYLIYYYINKSRQRRTQHDISTTKR